VASYDHAIRINPDYADAHYNRGIVLNDLKRLPEAFASYDRALTLKPDHEFLYGYWLMTKMMLCDWSDYHAKIIQLTDKIEQGEKVLAPFITLSQSSSRALQKKSRTDTCAKQMPG
jgi:tetratricopeptide (TPR) repeat protein